jgi:hypothetical protein
MRILIPGGSGQIGTILARHLHANGHEVTILSRNPQPAPWRMLPWDGLTEGPWTTEIDHSDAVIHLSGRTVNYRYNAENHRQIFDSRIKPTLLLGKLISASPTPPRIWMNASTSTFYRNALDRPQDEFTGELGGLPSQRGTHEPANYLRPGLSPSTSRTDGKRPSQPSQRPTHERFASAPPSTHHRNWCRGHERRRHFSLAIGPSLTASADTAPSPPRRPHPQNSSRTAPSP